jgi:tetratricopeptide (TPR) repeat protein
MPKRVSQRSGREAARTGTRRWSVAWVGVVAATVVVAGAVTLLVTRPWLTRVGGGKAAASAATSVPEDERKVFAAYAGSESCRQCHEEAYRLWEHSNHGLAERVPTLALDRTAFEPPRSFRHGSQETSVRLDGTNCLVTGLGLSGTNETHPVVRVIGNDPLRQFLVAAPGGRLQTLEASYDPRSNQWFNVYGSEDRRPGEWGHWTGRGMNWNSMCAGCHNTRVRKNYAEATDTYHTATTELTVSCESCHGPLKAHVEWQKQYGRTGEKDPTLPKFSHRQVLDNCGFCHARRTDLTSDFKPGDSFFDHQSLAGVDQSDHYYADGQVREENYEFAAFLGSKMHARGVYCLDCHNPHSMKTLLPGNWLCLRCHSGSYTNAPVIDPVAHSHHMVFGYNAEGKLVNSDLTTYKPREVKETGGECVNCHMPQTVYMQRHWRHDHGFTIPDPLLTKQYGIPNACNRCHTDKSADWALDTCAKWYGSKMERPTRQRAQVIARARQGDASARQALLDLLNGDESPYWKAATTSLLGQWFGEASVRDALLRALADPDPLVREQAVRALEPLATTQGAFVAAALRKLLADPARSVRVSAAWALRAGLPADTQAARDLQYYLKLNADQPSGQLQAGAFALANDRLQEALAHYQKAVAWDTNSAATRHDFAVALSALGRNREAIEQLEAACRLQPGEAEYQFKLGLAWNEAGSVEKTVAALEQATRLDPRHARAWFNLGLARNALGQTDAALDALIRAESLAPNDPQIPYARATILAHVGRQPEARVAAGRALELNPGYADARRLLEELSQPASPK